MSGNLDLLEAAIGNHQSGRLGEAEKLYRQVLESDPEQPDAWHLLGVLTSQRGNPKLAIEYIGRAIRLNPADTGYLTNLGVVYQGSGDLDRAVDCYRRALGADPGSAEVHNNLGNALREKGQKEEAISHFRRSLETNPGFAEAHFNLGMTLREAGTLEEAISHLRRASELRPGYLKALVHLAGALKSHGDLAGAIASYKRALDLDANNPDVLNEAGICFHEQGDLANASACYRRATQLRPGFAEAHNNLGTAYQDLGDTAAAAGSYRHAIQINPSLTNAHINLGNALRESKEWDGAVASYQRALSIDPDSISALCQLVHLKKHLCDWDDLAPLSQKVIGAVENGSGSVPPFTFINLSGTTPAQHLKCARQFVRDHAGISLCRNTRLDFSFAKAPQKKLTVGYVSADFREHAMGSLFAELFSLHDRDRFDVIGYSHGPDDGSATRERIIGSFDRVEDIRDVSFVDAARRIYRDKVDILVDLMGHQHHARNEIFALRPAPIQVNYLAYPGTSGMDFMDYILVDEFSVPPDQQEFYTEKLVHLPGCYQVNDSRRQISEVTPTRSECGLPESGTVFCGFNQTYKITPEIFATWMRLLNAVEGSVLWLWESSRGAAQNLQEEAKACGVDPSRLVFAPRKSTPDHLARYRLADLVLDTFPYNGHTTTSDSLWAGCPVLTLAGETFPSRVAGSLLRAIGLSELITYSLPRYEQLGLELASDPKRLQNLRLKIAGNREGSALFDSREFTRNLETAYGGMWESHVENLTS